MAWSFGSSQHSLYLDCGRENDLGQFPWSLSPSFSSDMETTERIVEAYVRHVKGWATISNIKCDGQLEIDLLAIDPVNTRRRYHIEVSVSGSQAYSKLTNKPFDREQLKKRTQVAKMRRTLGYFIEHKFKPKPVIAKLKKYGFKKNKYQRIVVTWDSTQDAKVAAKTAGIELWDFRDLMLELAASISEKRTYFTDDTLRTINLFARAQRGVQPADES